jgi:hypothetical protein
MLSLLLFAPVRRQLRAAGIWALCWSAVQGAWPLNPRSWQKGVTCLALTPTGLALHGGMVKLG